MFTTPFEKLPNLRESIKQKDKLVPTFSEESKSITFTFYETQ